jgi:nucleoside phosphorylase
MAAPEPFSPDAPDPSPGGCFGTPADLKGKVDFAIVTIKPEELQAIRDQFVDSAFTIVSGARAYAVTEVPVRGGAAAVVAVTRCASQGNGVAQDVARDIITELDPQWLLVVGIAGAAPDSAFTLGDVVLATSMLDFSVEAVKSGQYNEYAVQGREVHPAVENYAAMVSMHAAELGSWNDLKVPSAGDAVRRPLAKPPIELEGKIYAEKEWGDEVRRSVAQHATRSPDRPLVIGTPMASSDKLMKDDELLARWMSIARHIRAVEMESAGIYIAARGRGDARRSYPAMSIRGISDIVGLKRHEAWTRYACESAAAFTYAFVRSGYVRPRARGGVSRAGAEENSTAAGSSARETSGAPQQGPPTDIAVYNYGSVGQQVISHGPVTIHSPVIKKNG